MDRSYKVRGINLKSMPMGESDRLLTILTPELGLIQAIAPGSRKPKSTMGGRSGLFVINELLIYKGRSLDRITQAETVESYPGLSKDLGKLAAGQYLAELALYQALSDQPQAELFFLLGEHLSRISRSPTVHNHPSFMPVIPLLTHGIYHLLALGGIAPQVHHCCLTQQKLQPDFTQTNWQVGFSILGGGTVSSEWMMQNSPPMMSRLNSSLNSSLNSTLNSKIKNQNLPAINSKLNAVELAMLQQLTHAELPPVEVLLSQLPSPLRDLSLNQVWLTLEQLLRQYTQIHLERSLRSPILLDTYLKSIF
jgi:DNA repair protein RecO (recombination protein O)